MRKVTKGSVTIKLWDLGGQPRFRSMWERYCRGVNAIVYVPRTRPTRIVVSSFPLRSAQPRMLSLSVFATADSRPNALGFGRRMRQLLRRYVCDSADHDSIEVAKNELHDLMKKPALANIPLLVSHRRCGHVARCMPRVSR